MKLTRRRLLWFLPLLVLPVVFQLVRLFDFLFPRRRPPFRYVRPPGAGPEERFLADCIRCRACANVCQAGCIRFFTLLESPRLAGTPYLNTRLRSCNLCMNCTHICPTGALSPIERDMDEIARHVRMGTAVVVKTNCLSYNGRICGVCHDACPLKGKAITLVPRAKPVVDEDHCIGCGRCEERCPQFPSAIMVVAGRGGRHAA